MPMQPPSSSRPGPAGELADPLLRAAFDTLAPELDSFAESHALLVQRYQRGFSMWTFLFQHPKGGAASLQFNITQSPETGRLSASVLSHWWLDVEPGQRRLVAVFPTAGGGPPPRRGGGGGRARGGGEGGGG